MFINLLLNFNPKFQFFLARGLHTGQFGATFLNSGIHIFINLLFNFNPKFQKKMARRTQWTLLRKCHRSMMFYMFITWFF